MVRREYEGALEAGLAHRRGVIREALEQDGQHLLEVGFKALAEDGGKVGPHHREALPRVGGGGAAPLDDLWEYVRQL